MVSSKCFQVESPSPFKFLAALIPPWAQTECERFTGTMENRSTSPPISAILMTAARPARPPPMTMIFGAAMLCESDLVQKLQTKLWRLAHRVRSWDVLRVMFREQCFQNLNPGLAAAA